ncbi:DUF222 domain-containing protein, partial [Paractinoplanes rhizophilus]
MTDLQQLGEDAAKLAAAPVWPLSDDELTEALRRAHRLHQATLTLQARLVQQATTRGVPTTQGYRSTSHWLRALLLLDPQPARDLADAATALHHPAIEQALIHGHLDLRQATAIAATIDTIPTDLADITDPGLTPQTVTEIIDQAEHTMIEMAGRLPAYQLRRVGDRILTHIAPHLADQADEAALTRQETRAHRRRSLTLSLPLDGLVRITGVLSAEDAATIHAALHPLTRPTPTDDRTPAQRRADALIDICRLALRTRQLPDDGGEPP